MPPFIAALLPHKTAILIVALAFLVTNIATGFIAYDMGSDAKEAEYVAAKAKQDQTNATANAEALAREMAASVERAKTHSEINSQIEGSHEKDDDAPAPAIVQHYFERLRRSAQ